MVLLYLQTILSVAFADDTLLKEPAPLTVVTQTGYLEETDLKPVELPGQKSSKYCSYLNIRP